MVSRWGATVALVAGAVLLGAPLAAYAEDPVDLGGAYVLDTVGAVAGDEAEVQDALDSLYDRANIQLFVVYVSTFENPADPVAWADATAIDNGLGVRDALLAVAVDDRQYALSVDQDFPLTDAQLSSVESAIESELRGDNWAQAAIVGANTIASEATGVVGPNEPGDQSTGGGIPILPIVGGVAVVGVGVFIFSRIRRRNREGSVTAVPEQMTQKQLDTRAGSLLVQLDDSLKTSEQELGFAVAQFGDDATKDFTAALQRAKAKVAEAFTLKQRLDDHEPDSDADKRAWTTQIIQLCEAADAELDSQADSFDALRQLEKNAPDALATVIADATTARERLAAARETLTELSGRYAETAVAAVSGNTTQASKLLEFADAAAGKAKAAIAAGDLSTAAIAVRTAQSSVGQAGQLFAAIDDLERELDETTSKLEAAAADTAQDIAAARALPADTSGTLAPAIAAAEASLAAAAATKGDPIASLNQVAKANAALESVFTGVRDDQARVAHATTQLDASITAARSQIRSAMEYITTRRGGIGEAARTRVSEADRHLQQAIALSATDPVGALAEAKRANDLGASAFELAQGDVETYAARENFNTTSSSSAGWAGGSDGADLGGLLGGLLGGAIRAGGSSSRSSGSSGWSGGSRGSRSGSFGGSSRSAVRSAGGRRSRGGRF